MMFEKDKEIYSDLIQYMESHDYSQDHIARIKTELKHYRLGSLHIYLIPIFR